MAASQIFPSTPFACSECDCEYHEDKKDCSSFAHPRARSAQWTSATPNAIAIHAVIVASIIRLPARLLFEGASGFE